MRVIKIHIITLFILLIAIAKGYNQDNINFKTKIDSTVIGFDIPINITLKGNTNIDSFRLQVMNFDELLKALSAKINLDSFGNYDITPDHVEKTDFEISDYGNWKGKVNVIIPSNSKSNTVRIKIWDTGQFIILPVIIKRQNNKIDTLYPENSEYYPQISVFAGINPKDTLKSIAPIKDIIREKKNWEDYMWIYIIVGGIILIGLLLWFLPKLLINKKTVEQKKKVIKKIIPAHIIALKKLNKLKEEKIWKQGKIKEFQSQLTYILREYLEKRYKIRALEQTTGEIVHSLQKINLDNKDIEVITNILQIADMVKFAKAKPGEDINEKFLDETIDFVERTKEILNE